MRFFVLTIATLVAIHVAGATAVRAAGGTLTGEMAAFNYLLGSWNCTTNVPAMGPRPAHTNQTAITFEVVPGNVFHDHVASPEYVGDDYFGYDAQAKTYWSSSVDNMGAHGASTSTDGKTYTGTSAIGPATMNLTTTYTKVSATNVTVHEIMTGGGQEATIDATCSR